jgi:hypothetical protein
MADAYVRANEFRNSLARINRSCKRFGSMEAASWKDRPFTTNSLMT